MSADARALRAVALQAMSSLQAVIEQAGTQLTLLARVVDATATPEVLASDPDSPAMMQQALTVARAELAATREALAPFAHAWSRKMEQLVDVDVVVFVDPQRPDRSRSICLRDLKRANQVFGSLTHGVELLDRLHDAESLLARLSHGEDVRPQALSHLDRVGAGVRASTEVPRSDSDRPPSSDTSKTPPA